MHRRTAKICPGSKCRHDTGSAENCLFQDIYTSASVLFPEFCMYSKYHDLLSQRSWTSTLILKMYSGLLLPKTHGWFLGCNSSSKFDFKSSN